MPKEEGPLEYERRIRDTKDVAQRLDFDYLKGSSWLQILRKRMTLALVAVAALASVPLMVGLGGRRAVENGPVSAAHAMFEGRCEVCHSQAFAGVPDHSCTPCHNEGPHPAKQIDTAKLDAPPRCATCHVEHRGRLTLAQVPDGDCTSCHANLARHAQGLHVKALEIMAFRQGRHPDFGAAALSDTRPLKLNHAAHMPAEPKEIRGMKLPMQCSDCHVTDVNSPSGALLPVTFEQNCKNCHRRELEFDVYGVLGTAAKPAPHTKDANLIRQIVWTTYRDALSADPSLAKKPIGNDLNPPPSAQAWLDRVTGDSVSYLLDRKCNYCHVGDPMVSRAGRIAGRYPDGSPWLQRGEFSHHAHRAVACESCHTTARASQKTEDVLVPAMKACLPCHGASSAGLDRCSECHLYHNRSREKENRRPVEQILGAVRAAESHGGRALARAALQRRFGWLRRAASGTEVPRGLKPAPQKPFVTFGDPQGQGLIQRGLAGAREAAQIGPPGRGPAAERVTSKGCLGAARQGRAESRRGLKPALRGAAQ